jgi:DNA-directed RNA polymerase specialized sigma24 family protein
MGTHELSTDSNASPSSTGSGLTVERAVSLLLIMVRQQMRGRDRDQRESMDVVQSIAVDLLSRKSGFLDLDPDSQRRYLHVVARHKLGQLARRDQALKRGGGVETPLATALDPASSMSGPATVLCTRHEMDAMREGLERLEPETRSVLALQAAGIPYDAIAQMMETSDQAARQKFVRAKRDLIILAQTAAGCGWTEVAVATGLSEDEARKRHARLCSID